MMKTALKEEAKNYAKTQSLNKDYKDVPVYIIHCSRTKLFYVDTDSLIRLWEQLMGYYINGVFTNEEHYLE